MKMRTRHRRFVLEKNPGGDAYCLHCFARIPREARRCPMCGRHSEEISDLAYREKLLRALEHPIAEVRMRAILALGLRGEPDTAPALIACALRRPSDVVEGLEIVRSLGRLDAGRPCGAALRDLANRHPASAVKAAASRVLVCDFEQQAQGHQDAVWSDRSRGRERR